jgi:hypothetical protein
MDVDPHINPHTCPFLASLSQILKPCHALLKVCFNKFDINVMQANQNLFIDCTILVGLRHGMPKKVLSKSSSNQKFSQLTMTFNDVIIAPKLIPLSLM